MKIKNDTEHKLYMHRNRNYKSNELTSNLISIVQCTNVDIGTIMILHVLVSDVNSDIQRKINLKNKTHTHTRQ